MLATGVRSEEAAKRIDKVNYLSISEEELYDLMGDMATVMSHSCSGREFIDAIDIGSDDAKHSPAVPDF